MPALLLTAFAAAAEEPAAPDVNALRIEGVDVVKKKELYENMVTRRPFFWRFWKDDPDLLEGALAQDMQRIEGVYRKHGYYRAKARYEIEWDDEHDDADVTIFVEEGPPVRVAEVTLAWADGAEPGDVADALDAVALELPLRVGDVFTLDGYREARGLVLERLAQRARPAARIEGGADVDVAAGEARVLWRLDPGPRVLFGAVRVVGLEDVQPHVVQRELRVEEGNPFDPRALDRTRRRLVALQLFRYVSVLPQRDEAFPASPDAPVPVVWPVEVELRERPPRSVAVGGGWGSDEGPRGILRWSHRNWLGDGRRLEIGGSGSAIQQQGHARVLQPYVFGTQAALEAGARFFRRDRDSYDSTETSLTVGPRRAFGEHWVGEALYRFGWTRVSNIEFETEEVLREQRDSGFLSGVGVRFRRSELDDDRNPSRGTWLELGIGTDQRVLGSNYDWLRYDAEVRGYLPLGPLVGAARLQVRTIDPFGSTEPGEVPLSERLYLGGAHLGRGFPFEKLGPLDPSDEPLGGTSSVLASVELRFPIWKQLSGAVFVDAGQVSLAPFEFDADEIGVGVGPGLAVTTPLGAVGLYAGYPLNPLETDKRWRFHFSVGYGF